MYHKASEIPPIAVELDIDPVLFSKNTINGNIYLDMVQNFTIRLDQTFRNLQHTCAISLINSSSKDALVVVVQFCGLLSHLI